MQTTEKFTVSSLSVSSRRAALLLLEALFIGIVAVVSVWGSVPAISQLAILILLVPATFRMARTISFNEVGEPLRAPFTEVRPDSCGAGADVHPVGDPESLQHVLGSLLSCPICSGTWSALILYGLWCLWPTFGQNLITVLAIAGGSEVLHWLSGMLEWVGRAGRVISGCISPDRE